MNTAKSTAIITPRGRFVIVATWPRKGPVITRYVPRKSDHRILNTETGGSDLTLPWGQR